MASVRALWPWAAAALLGLASFGAFSAAEARDVDVVATERVIYEQAPGTPLLSARRLPMTLQAPVVDDRIAPVLSATAGKAPEASCIQVQVDGRTLEPTTNATSGLVPASNQKLLTTFAALGILQPDFTFTTRVRSTAPLEGGIVDGDLYLVGDGDPFLTTENWWEQYENTNGRFNTSLEALADNVQASGLVTVTGDLIGDESLFDSERSGPWADRLIAQKQSGPLSALTVNEGFVDWPSAENGSVRQRSDTNDPPVHAVSVFRQLLAERGITIEGGNTSGIAPENTAPIAEIDSPPLTDIVTHVNSYSSNIGAELLLKRVGHRVSGRGSTEAGASAMFDFLRTEGIPTEGLVLEDGSGLAETNRLTCRAVAALLEHAEADEAFRESLAISGTRGSLLERMVDTEAEGAVSAKTGTLQGSSALSGYVRSANDEDTVLVFAFISNEDFINGPEIRDMQDEFVVALTDYPGSPTVEDLAPLAPVASG